MKDKTRNSYPCVSVNPDILNTTRHEACPSPQLVFITQIRWDVRDEDCSSLSKRCMRRRGEKLVSLLGIMRELAADEEENPNYRE